MFILTSFFTMTANIRSQIQAFILNHSAGTTHLLIYNYRIPVTNSIYLKIKALISAEYRNIRTLVGVETQTKLTSLSNKGSEN
jgi:cystathionine beta-lyase/cystathionine gamma-synthase